MPEAMMQPMTMSVASKAFSRFARRGRLGLTARALGHAANLSLGRQAKYRLPRQYTVAVTIGRVKSVDTLI
jgi:hypothetical protein